MHIDGMIKKFGSEAVGLAIAEKGSEAAALSSLNTKARRDRRGAKAGCHESGLLWRHAVTLGPKLQELILAGKRVITKAGRSAFRAHASSSAIMPFGSGGYSKNIIIVARYDALVLAGVIQLDGDETLIRRALVAEMRLQANGEYRVLLYRGSADPAADGPIEIEIEALPWPPPAQPIVPEADYSQYYEQLLADALLPPLFYRPHQMTFENRK